MTRMLIVDDEERIVNSLYGLMEEHFDLEIHRAYSAVSAMSLVRRMRFDLMISDISMPQMSGLELLAEVRRLWPRCYVLLLTAYDRFDYAYRAMKYDRVDYLLKIESYDEICRVVQEKLTLMAQEQQEDEKLLRLGDDLSAISQSVQRYFLKRIILQGTPLPDGRELDGIPFPMALDRPALLVLGSLETAGPAERSRVIGGIDDYLAEKLPEAGLQGVSCASAGYAFWVFQPTGAEGYNQAEQRVFLQELLDDLPDMVEKRLGKQLALLCADAFVPWQELHALYQHAAVHLEQWRNESGTVILSVNEEMTQRPAYGSFPNLDEVNMLWEMMKCGNAQGLTAMLREGLAPLRQARQLAAALPSASVTGVAFLLAQAASLYAPELMGNSAFRRLLNGQGYEDGESWVADVIRTVEDILDHRAASQRNMGIWLVERINQYIEQHFAEDITLAALADEVHYSPSYLSRFYKTHTGKNLMAAISGVRIAHAKTLLTKTNLKISDIAAQCGFCSTKYFNQVFKRMTDVSAVQYRDQGGML